MSLLLGWLAPYRALAEGAALALLIALCGIQTARLHSARADVADAKAETAVLLRTWQRQVADGEKAAFNASEKYRALEARMNDRVQEATHAQAIDTERNAAALRSVAAERDSVRRQLAAFARGPARGGEPAADALAACSLRAAALGDGLADVMRHEEDLVGELESSRADTRTLLASWPRD